MKYLKLFEEHSSRLLPNLQQSIKDLLDSHYPHIDEVNPFTGNPKNLIVNTDYSESKYGSVIVVTFSNDSGISWSKVNTEIKTEEFIKDLSNIIKEVFAEGDPYITEYRLFDVDKKGKKMGHRIEDWQKNPDGGFGVENLYQQFIQDWCGDRSGIVNRIYIKFLIPKY